MEQIKAVPGSRFIRLSGTAFIMNLHGEFTPWAQLKSPYLSGSAELNRRFYVNISFQWSGIHDV